MDITLTGLTGPWWRPTSPTLSEDRRRVNFDLRSERVVPRGVDPLLPELVGGGGRRFEATPMKYTTGDVLEDLRVLSTLPKDEQPEYILEHVRNFGISNLSARGLPLTQVSPVTCDFQESGWGPVQPTLEEAGRRFTELGSIPAQSSGLLAARTVDVQAVVRLADYFDAILVIASRISAGMSLSTDPTAPIRALPGIRMPPHLISQIQHGRFGRLVVEEACDQFLALSGVAVGAAWPQRKSPHLLAKSPNSWGLLMLEVIRQLGTEDSPELYVCSVCNRRFSLPRRPKGTDRYYCSDAECQRRRKAINRRNERIRKKAHSEDG